MNIPPVVLANAGIHRTLALSKCSMGPRVREDDGGGVLASLDSHPTLAHSTD
jgi:hypothetical protein